MLYRVQGIVIRSMDYGEGNAIITLCTENAGKAGVLVRGARKVKSRHAALIQPFTEGEFTFFRGGGLGTLNAGEIIRSHHPLREDLTKAAYAAYACELLDRVLHDDEVGTFWFRQLSACLEGLEQDKDPDVIISLYELKVLQGAGYAPQLDNCVMCGKERPEEQLLISPRLGGVLCRSCRHHDPPALEASPRTLKLLRLLAALDMTRLGNVAVKDETRDELKKLMRAFMDVQLGLKLKSRGFLDQLDKYKI